MALEISAEAAHEKRVAEDRNGAVTGLRFVGRESPVGAEQDAKHGEDTGRGTSNATARVASPAPMRVPSVRRIAAADSKTGPRLRICERIERQRESIELEGAQLRPDCDEAIGLGIGERAEEDGVGNAENGSAGADAQGDGDDRGEG